MFPSLRLQRNIQSLEDNCKNEFIRVHYIQPCSIYSIIIIIIIIGFESNFSNNAVRKKRKISELDQRNK